MGMLHSSWSLDHTGLWSLGSRRSSRLWFESEEVCNDTGANRANSEQASWSAVEWQWLHATANCKDKSKASWSCKHTHQFQTIEWIKKATHGHQKAWNSRHSRCHKATLPGNTARIFSLFVLISLCAVISAPLPLLPWFLLGRPGGLENPWNPWNPSRKKISIHGSPTQPTRSTRYADYADMPWCQYAFYQIRRSSIFGNLSDPWEIFG